MYRPLTKTILIKYYSELHRKHRVFALNTIMILNTILNRELLIFLRGINHFGPARKPRVCSLNTAPPSGMWRECTDGSRPYFTSVLKVFEGVGAISEGPDGAPPWAPGGAQAPPSEYDHFTKAGCFWSAVHSGGWCSAHISL